MVSLPGWDSLESVSRWVTFYEFAMIIILTALIGAQVLHFRYSHRKDTLIEMRARQRADDTTAFLGDFESKGFTKR
jgi:hypothetical protein